MNQISFCNVSLPCAFVPLIIWMTLLLVLPRHIGPQTLGQSTHETCGHSFCPRTPRHSLPLHVALSACQATGHEPIKLLLRALLTRLTPESIRPLLDDGVFLLDLRPLRTCSLCELPLLDNTDTDVSY